MFSVVTNGFILLKQIYGSRQAKSKFWQQLATLGNNLIGKYLVTMTDTGIFITLFITLFDLKTASLVSFALTNQR